jgi:hypothetical protein
VYRIIDRSGSSAFRRIVQSTLVHSLSSADFSDVVYSTVLLIEASKPPQHLLSGDLKIHFIRGGWRHCVYRLYRLSYLDCRV